MFIIGELINGSRNKIKKAIEEKNHSFIQDIAEKQIKSGANALDVNAGVSPEKELDTLKWLIEDVQKVSGDTTLCIDSPNPKAIEMAIPLCKVRPIINSITGERTKLQKLLPILKTYKPKVIALSLDDNGIPQTSEKRQENAIKLIDIISKEEIPHSDIYVDPLITTIATDYKSGAVVFDTIKAIKKKFPDVHITCGISNISYGLPARKEINRVSLIMAIAMGLDSVIMDPCDENIIKDIIIAETVSGRDEYCSKFLSFYREKKL